MKSSTASEYIVLTALTLVAGFLFYREHLAHSAASSHGLPVRAAVAKSPQESRVNAAITAEERNVIRAYVAACSESERYGNKGPNVKSLSPGLTKRISHGRSLRPGWEQKLTKGEVMPAEVFRECYLLPDEVTARLPAPPDGTVLVAIDGKVVRLARASMEILDVFDTRGPGIL